MDLARVRPERLDGIGHTLSIDPKKPCFVPFCFMWFCSLAAKATIYRDAAAIKTIFDFTNSNGGFLSYSQTQMGDSCPAAKNEFRMRSARNLSAGGAGGAPNEGKKGEMNASTVEMSQLCVVKGSMEIGSCREQNFPQQSICLVCGV